MSEISQDQGGAVSESAVRQGGVQNSLAARLVTSLQSAGDAMIITDLEGRVEFLNAAAERLTGFERASAEEQDLQHILKIRESRGGPLRQDLVSLAIINEAPLALGRDIVIVTATGETRQIEGEISVRLNAGVPTGTVITFRDVSARNWEELQRREEQKLAAVSRLAGAVAHELNNLLTVVLGHSESLEEMYPDLAPLHASTAEIRRVTAGIATMTRQLMTLSRREVLQPKSLELNSLIEQLAPLVRKTLPSSVEFRLDLDPGIGRIFADQSQIEQAITDLVQHCGNRLHKSGKLTVSTAKVVVDPNLRAQHLRHYVRLTIEDSGPSLNGQAIEDLFEPSWDCNPSRPPGIGLFTVRNMIAAANGHFSIESDFPAGARFVLLFPESEAELLPEDRNGMSVKPPTSRTVLFVEDNDSIRILLRNAFERKGYRVIEARDGEEAMLQSSLHPEPIDLLISDVVMPFMDGPSLARKLSAQRPDMKVILISGCPVDPEAVSELVAGGAQFVLKPFTQRDLLAQAQRILDGK